MRPRVSVLIVTWNCRDLIGPCLDHLFASRIEPAFETILVDNASHDGTADFVRARYPQVAVVDSGSNMGFGRGNNLAASLANGDHLLLLNPDAYLVDPDAFAALVGMLEADVGGRVAAVAPMLVNPDGSHQVGDGGFAPTLGNVVRHQWLISRFVPSARGFYITRPADLRRDRVAVQWLAATCLLVRRSVFDEVGGFDPAFFMYGEDVDLGLRIDAAGGIQWLLPSIRVVHLQGATQRADPNAIHVSFGWIDAIFALYETATWRQRLRRHTLAAAMGAGFGVRAAAYRVSGRTPRAVAMARYARYSWDRRRPPAA